ncbi:MAG: hypothetical protein EOM03_14795 [Clostridia bacterium]|nr:hypothetical protein [Clostridia bacterium]
MKGRFISGADIVGKRSWRKAELSDAFLNHGLGCYRPHFVEKEYYGKSCITCVRDGARERAEPGDECFNGCGGYPHEVVFAVYLERLMECDFDLADIENLEEELSLGAVEDLELVSGAELLNQGIGAADLLRFIKKGHVSPPTDRTPKSDPCLFCDPLVQGEYPSCLGKNKPCEQSPLLLCDTATEADLHSRLSKALFPSDALRQLKAILSGPDAQREDAVVRRHAPDRQIEDSDPNFKMPKEFADHHRVKGAKAGWIMLEIVRRYGLKKYEAAAVALGDPVPEKSTPQAKSYGERFRYHVGLLDMDE